MGTALRLRDRDANTHFIAEASGKVYADQEKRGSLGRTDQATPELTCRVLESVYEYYEFFERAIPGNVTPDGKFEVRGRLTLSEHRALEGGESVPCERPAMLLHLDFFDEDLDGRITFGENCRGWRRLGFRWYEALWKALLSSFIFGWLKGWAAIEVARFERIRYAGSTGIYDQAGRIDQERLDEYVRDFSARGHRLDFDEVIWLLHKKSATGMVSRMGKVSRGQFRSLFRVCERLNRGEKVVTSPQFRGLFDGSLLWLAASTTDNAGRRAQWSSPGEGAAWNARAAIP